MFPVVLKTWFKPFMWLLGISTLLFVSYTLPYLLWPVQMDKVVNALRDDMKWVNECSNTPDIEENNHLVVSSWSDNKQQVPLYITNDTLTELREQGGGGGGGGGGNLTHYVQFMTSGMFKQAFEIERVGNIPLNHKYIKQMYICDLLRTQREGNDLGKARDWFYHYMERLWLPVLWYISQFKPTQLVVYTKQYQVDHGDGINGKPHAFDTFWNEMQEHTGVVIRFIAGELPSKAYVLPRFDPPLLPDQGVQLHQASVYLRYLVNRSIGKATTSSSDSSSSSSGRSPVIVQARQESSTGVTHNVRSVHNLEAISQKQGWSIHYLGGEKETLFHQMSRYVGRKVLVLGHGAGMVHYFAMDEGAVVVEILNLVQYEEVKEFKFLERITAATGGSSHSIVVKTNDNIFNVSEASLLRAVPAEYVRLFRLL